MAWNLSSEERTILIIDFYRPEKSREEMNAVESEQLQRRLDEDPASFGFSGGSKLGEITDEIKMEYGTSPVKIFDWGDE